MVRSLYASFALFAGGCQTSSSRVFVALRYDRPETDDVTSCDALIADIQYFVMYYAIKATILPFLIPTIRKLGGLFGKRSIIFIAIGALLAVSNIQIA